MLRSILTGGSEKNERVLIHVGPHKTGSTFLQAQLYEHRNDLKKAAWAYPKILFSHLGHHEIPAFLKRHPNDRGFRREMKRINRIRQGIILSSENFSNLNASEFSLLKELLDAKTIEIVYYYRTPTVRLISLWQEHIKHGRSMSFFEYFTKTSIAYKHSRALNPMILIEDLITVFGVEHLHLVDYETAVDEGGIAKPLETLLQTPGLLSDTNEPVNAMRDLKEVELLRYCNMRANIERRKHNPDIIRKNFDLIKSRETDFVEEIKKLLEPYINPVKLGSTGVDRELHRMLSRRYENLFLNRPSRPRPQKYRLVTDAYMGNREVMASMEGLFRKVEELMGNNLTQ